MIARHDRHDGHAQVAPHLLGEQVVEGVVSTVPA